MSSESSNLKFKQAVKSLKGDSSLSRGFDLYSIEDLESKLKQRTQNFISAVAPNTGLIAVGSGQAKWDVRPVIALSTEETPSVLRLLGPEVARAPEVAAVVKHTFETLQKQGSLNADFREWGEYQGQIWFRRALVKDTLFSKLLGKTDLGISQGVSIIISLIEEINLWHKLGVIHGHIANSNILVTPAGGVVLLDVAAGAAIISASSKPKALRVPFLAAPELVDRGALSDKADIYGIGQVIKRIVISLKKKYQFDDSQQEALKALKRFSELGTELTQEDPFKRPAIEEVFARAIGIEVPKEQAAATSEPFDPFAAITPEPQPVVEAQETIDIQAPVEPVETKDFDPFADILGSPAESSQPEPQESPKIEDEVKEPELAFDPFAAFDALEPEPAESPKPKIQQTESKRSDTEEILSLDELFAEATGTAEETSTPEAQEAPKPEDKEQEVPFDPFAEISAEPETTEKPKVQDSPSLLNPFHEPVEEKPATEEEKIDNTFDPFAGAFIDDSSLESPATEETAVDSSDELFDIDFEEKSEDLSSQTITKKHYSQPTSNTGNSFAMYLIIVGTLLAGIWWYFRGIDNVQTLDVSVAELKADWDSKIPSRMLTVAELAVDKEIDSKLIQDMIVSGAKQGVQLPTAVNPSLLRVAFHDRWEMELTPEDRRMALALGLAGLLRNKMPVDLGPLTERHPGVILAVTASAGENTRKILQKIPALSLANLPPPFGAAFRKLVEDDSDLSCASDSVHSLARFGTRGLDGVRPQEIYDYLAKDTTKRLQALAIIVSYDELPAKRVLDILLNNPNVKFKLAEVTWARTWDVLSWTDVDSADKLFLIAGIPSASKVSIDQLRTLFSHPNSKMRGYAIAQARQRLNFAHPGADAILALLEKQPELLNAEQLLRFGEIIQSPETVSDARIKSWLATNPPVQIVANLLLSRSELGKVSRTDTWFAYYLRNAGWEPELGAIKKLISHPDKYTRLYVYTVIQNKVAKEKINTAVARGLFQEALQNEVEPDYQDQLKLMLNQF